MTLPLIAGELTPISSSVWRLLAPNPSMMTGPGTNTYLLATPNNGLMVLDPGPKNEAHTKAMLAASQTLGRPITQILVTHTHNDHSPAAQELLAHYPEAQLLGQPAPTDGLQDEEWQPQVVLDEGQIIPLDNNETLRVIATPGHVGNHLCFLLVEQHLLFTGDHLIDGSTVVIAPPSGSMSAYLQSLAKLQSESLDFIAPGHGNLIAQPQDYIRETINHRLKREAKVLAALDKNQGQTLELLVTKAYADTPPMLHPLAQYSLWAHLIKLAEDGLAYEDKEKQWWLN